MRMRVAFHHYSARRHLSTAAASSRRHLSTAAASPHRSIPTVALRKEHGAIGNVPPTALLRDGINAVCSDGAGESRTRVLLGNACSEIFSGRALAAVLRPGHEYEARVLEALEADANAPPLVQHTAAAVPEALWTFLESFAPHVPQRARADADWCVNLQVEGASAVHAGVEMLLQLQAARGQPQRTGVACAAASYHGPATTSIGVPASALSAISLAAKPPQLVYPAPTPWRPLASAADVAQLRAEWDAFFREHGPRLGAVVIEPQWGSSCAGAMWPERLLREFIDLAHDHGALILSDEVRPPTISHDLPRSPTISY